MVRKYKKLNSPPFIRRYKRGQPFPKPLLDPVPRTEPSRTLNQPLLPRTDLNPVRQRKRKPRRRLFKPLPSEVSVANTRLSNSDTNRPNRYPTVNNDQNVGANNHGPHNSSAHHHKKLTFVFEDSGSDESSSCLSIPPLRDGEHRSDATPPSPSQRVRHFEASSKVQRLRYDDTRGRGRRPTLIARLLQLLKSCVAKKPTIS